jgi:hypothetical protein
MDQARDMTLVVHDVAWTAMLLYRNTKRASTTAWQTNTMSVWIELQSSRISPFTNYCSSEYCRVST